MNAVDVPMGNPLLPVGVDVAEPEELEPAEETELVPVGCDTNEVK